MVNVALSPFFGFWFYIDIYKKNMGNCCSVDDDFATTSLFDELDEKDDYCHHCDKRSDTLHNIVVSNKPLLVCDMCRQLFV